MSVEPTAGAIVLPSSSPIPLELPFGARAYPNGLDLPDGLNLEEWLQIGAHIVGVLRAGLFWWGDWLAYGQQSYNNEVWGRTLKHGTLDKAAEISGYARQTLMNAKWVCLRVDRSRRREGLTFMHLLEIVSKIPEAQTVNVDIWQERVARESLSVAALREKLREAHAVNRRDPVRADGTAEAMSKITEFTRFYRANSGRWHVMFKKRIAQELADVFEELRPYLATPVRKV